MGPKKRKAVLDDPAPPTRLLQKDDQENDDETAVEQEPPFVILPPYLIKRNPRFFCIPIGPGFQADVPYATEALDFESYRDLTKDSKWLGTRVWTADDDNNGTADIGRGRPTANCECRARGSENCVRLHVSDKRAEIKLQLGTAFEGLGFDTMGEDAASSWNASQERIFGDIVSRKKGLLRPGITVKLGKSYKEIISYYFNVLVLQRVSAQARHGGRVDSDDDTYSGKRRKTRVSQGASASSKYLKCPEPSIL